MGFTPEQIKWRIKSVAKQNDADARTLMRIYMMERFLERLAQSEYRDNFMDTSSIAENSWFQPLKTILTTTITAVTSTVCSSRRQCRLMSVP